ncbi:MAG: NUDIX hydrolase [Patescibacteria group bacterium]|nr:NUDIX hydrolase [Patescibacteria group bacterium]
MHTPDELLDLVDDNDNVIGQKRRSEIYAENLSNFRVINVFIVNSQGQIWIPRRAANKRIFPSCLDMSVGGHVETGESYEDALKRELQEEVNINLNQAQYTHLGHLTPKENGVSAFMNVYEIKVDQTPNYNEKDFTEFFWLTPEELFGKIKNGEKTKEDLPKLVKIFYRKN